MAFRQDLEDKKKLFESLQEEVQSAHYKYHDITNALERLKDKLDAASMDQRELEKQRQNRELLENLKRLFPGVVSGGQRCRGSSEGEGERVVSGGGEFGGDHKDGE